MKYDRDDHILNILLTQVKIMTMEKNKCRSGISWSHGYRILLPLYSFYICKNTTIYVLVLLTFLNIFVKLWLCSWCPKNVVTWRRTIKTFKFSFWVPQFWTIIRSLIDQSKIQTLENEKFYLWFFTSKHTSKRFKNITLTTKNM